MKIDKERAKLLHQIVRRIISEMKNQGLGFDVSKETWWETFVEKLHPLLDDAIGEYGLGSDDIFYMGAYFALKYDALRDAA
jgi:hypothetical protein